jgi:hypothetical protein
MISIRMMSVVAISGLLLTPVLPVLDMVDGGAAFAKGEKSEGNGGGNGNGNGNSGGNGNSEGNGKSSESKSSSKATATDDGMKPNELGKMNGAVNANINAVLAHIRNGQTSNGPVGLLAGLAVADAGAAAAAAEAEELQARAAEFDALETKLSEEGFASTEEYLAAKADGTATPEQIAAIDPLIEAVGGTNAEGTALAETAPTDEEIAAAEEAAAAAEAEVATVEGAIADAWNKEGDIDALLVTLREKLAPYADDIAAAAE